MFTLKFYSQDRSATPPKQILTVVGAVRYDVLEHAEGNYAISTYDKAPSHEEGTDFRVSNHEMDYASCYIENMFGKTIAHYHSVNVEPSGPGNEPLSGDQSKD